MVADAKETPNTTLAANPPAKQRKTGYDIPLHTRVRARNLYLSQGLPPNVIAKETSLTADQVRNMAFREGWTKLRAQQKKRLEAASDARSSEIEKEILDHAVSLAGQHVLKGLENVGKALERDQLTDECAAKDFQSYTSGVKNLVGVIRDVRTPVGADLEASGGRTLNLFFCAPTQPVSKDGYANAKDVTNAAANSGSSAKSVNETVIEIPTALPTS